MKIDFGIWDKLPKDDIANMIVSGVKSLDDLRPSENIIRQIGDIHASRSVLDFGCGVGRNIAGMMRLAPTWSVVGYDNKLMVARATEFLSGVDVREMTSVRLESDWNEIVKIAYLKKIDTIFCCLVLQHIPETQLRWYLEQFKNIGNELFVFGRRALDPSNTNGYDGGKIFRSVWDTIIDSGFDIMNAQDGFIESAGGFNEGKGNDHHWAIFKPRGIRQENVRGKDRKKRS